MTKSEDAEMKGITVIKRFALALLLACPMPGALAQTPTPPAPVEYYRSNIGHTGVAAEKLTPPLSLVWRHTTGQAKNNPASAVFADSTAFFVSAGFVYAVNSHDGTLKWQYPSGAKSSTYFATTPALSGGALYVTDDNGQVYKLEAATGHELWTRKLDGAIRSAPVLSGGMVYFGSGNSHCYALSADTGQVVWDVATNGAVTTSPTITGGLIVFTSSDNNVYSLSARTGHKAWSIPFDADPSILPVVYDGAALYVTAGDTIYGLDPGNGARRFTRTLPTNILQPPTISRDAVYVITQTNVLYALTSAGRSRWHVTLNGAASAPPLLAGNLLLIATQSGILSGYDISDGKHVWQYVMQATATDSQPKSANANVAAAPILAGGTLYVVSDDGSLSAFRSDAPDDVSPQLTQLVPEANSTVPSAGLSYGAYLADDGSGIDPATVSLSLDGQADAKAQYQAGQNAVYETPDSPLAEGSHRITVKAVDWRGNATTKSWSFTVNDHPASAQPGSLNPNAPNYPGSGRNPVAPPPPPPLVPF